MLEEIIRRDLKKAIIKKNEVAKETLRMVLGEIPRLNKKSGEKATDQEIENIIRKLIKAETQVLELTNKDPDKSHYIMRLTSYIPKLMSEDEVRLWISENVNLDDFNPKIKAMGVIMKSLKGKVDGNIVKQMLLK